MDEAATGCKQPSFIVCNGRDRANGTGYVIRADRRERAIVADRIAVDATGQNVHAQQFVSTRVPPGAFAEVLLLARAGDGVRVVRSRCGLPAGSHHLFARRGTSAGVSSKLPVHSEGSRPSVRTACPAAMPIASVNVGKASSSSAIRRTSIPAAMHVAAT